MTLDPGYLALLLVIAISYMAGYATCWVQERIARRERTPEQRAARALRTAKRERRRRLETADLARRIAAERARSAALARQIAADEDRRRQHEARFRP